MRRDFTHGRAQKYEGPRLRNPLFQDVPDRFRKISCLALLVVIPLAVVGICVYAPFMQYRHVVIDGLTTLQNDAVQQTVWDVLHRRTALVLPGTNILTARLGALEQKLNATYHFDELTLRREGATLHIAAVERITELAWLSGGKILLLDLNGVALQEASPEASAMIAARRADAETIPTALGLQPTMPIITDATGNEVAIGSTVVTSDIIASILALDEELRRRAMKPIGYTFVEEERLWVSVTTRETALYIDLRTPINETMTYFDAFLGEHRADLSRYAYVDLRFANHIYTKPR